MGTPTKHNQTRTMPEKKAKTKRNGREAAAGLPANQLDGPDADAAKTVTGSGQTMARAAEPTARL